MLVTAQMTRHVSVADTMISIISVRRLAAIEIVRALLRLAQDIVAMLVLLAVVTLPVMVTAVAVEMEGVEVYPPEGETIVNEAQIDLVGSISPRRDPQALPPPGPRNIQWDRTLPPGNIKGILQCRFPRFLPRTLQI